MKTLEEKLAQRKQSGNLRTLATNEGLVDFFSNDYLGIARNQEVRIQIDKAFELLNEQKHINGSTGSRLLSGNHSYALATEARLAKVFQAEASLVFNSGYNANLAILSSVPQKDDTIIYDELIHASLKDGARLSFAKRLSFRHNDLADLENKLQKSQGEKFVVVESVYSMDGDTCPLLPLIELCERHHAHVILDEAHSTGIWGRGGNGMACELNIQDKLFARIYTFGKAIGLHGACIAGSKLLIDYLINFARPFIYTTSIPLHSFVAVQCVFDYLIIHPELAKGLFEKINLFRTTIAEKYSTLFEQLHESSSAIQVLRISGNERARHVAQQLQTQGFDARAILSPTVKEGEERLRICIHSYNSNEEIVTLANAIGVLI